MPDWIPPMSWAMVESTGPEISFRASMPSAVAFRRVSLWSRP